MTSTEGTVRFKTAAIQRWQRQLLLGITPLLVGTELLCALVFLPQAVRGCGDFRQLYAGAFLVRSGNAHRLYDADLQLQAQNAVVSPATQVLPSNHPSLEYVVLSPLTLVSYRFAYFVWFGLNLGALLLCARLLPGDTWMKVFVFAGFATVVITLLQGQDTLWFFLLLLLAFRCDSEFHSGLLLGCGAFRFHLLLPILLAYLVWRRWRFLAGALTSGGLLALLSVWIVGWRESLAYVKTTAGSTDVLVGARLICWPCLRLACLSTTRLQLWASWYARFCLCGRLYRANHRWLPRCYWYQCSVIICWRTT